MNLPNTLTLSRIFIVPLLVAALMTELSERWFGIPRQIFGVTLFLSASFTDWLDGYLARRHGQVTTLGTLLDPIADKLLISSALIALVENRLAPGWAVVIIIGREFAVTGLRTIAAQENLTIGASKMGKFKMLSQVVAITFLMLGSVRGGPPPLAEQTSLFAVQNAFETLFAKGSFTLLQWQQVSYGLGRFVMWTVVISAVWSMVDYFKDFYGAVSDRIEQRKRPQLKIGEAIKTRFRRRPRAPKRPLPPRTEVDKA